MHGLPVWSAQVCLCLAMLSCPCNFLVLDECCEQGWCQLVLLLHPTSHYDMWPSGHTVTMYIHMLSMKVSASSYVPYFSLSLMCMLVDEHSAKSQRDAARQSVLSQSVLSIGESCRVSVCCVFYCIANCHIVRFAERWLSCQSSVGSLACPWLH